MTIWFRSVKVLSMLRRRSLWRSYSVVVLDSLRRSSTLRRPSASASPVRISAFLPFPRRSGNGFLQETRLERSTRAHSRRECGHIRAGVPGTLITARTTKSRCCGAQEDLVRQRFFPPLPDRCFHWSFSREFNRVKDLKGKSVGIPSIGSLGHKITVRVLRKLGIDPDKDVRMVAVGGDASRVAAAPRQTDRRYDDQPAAQHHDAERRDLICCFRRATTSTFRSPVWERRQKRLKEQSGTG